ncbi:hypothetical protein C8R47DRAFT_529793 [Mycena vitilis]|nr:hypothetical protein C8R47DRAFT_529793 [Mycena vitilis]
MDFLRQSFVPVYASQQTGKLGTNSMIIGGSDMYLTADEAWPVCATCKHPLVPLLQLNVSSENTPPAFRGLIPSVVPAGESLATMVQLFVCPGEECYDRSTGYSTATRSWIVRVATVPLVPSSAATRIGAETGIDGDGVGFLPAKSVQSWTPGKHETLHYELLWGQNDSDEFYAAHEPEPGLKLLGNSVRGKYYCSEDECPKTGRHEFPSRRELIQIGDRFYEGEEDDALSLMATLGNTWIEQCVEHPEVLTLTMSGNW